MTVCYKTDIGINKVMTYTRQQLIYCSGNHGNQCFIDFLDFHTFISPQRCCRDFVERECLRKCGGQPRMQSSPLSILEREREDMWNTFKKPAFTNPSQLAGKQNVDLHVQSEVWLYSVVPILSRELDLCCTVTLANKGEIASKSDTICI